MLATTGLAVFAATAGNSVLVPVLPFFIEGAGAGSALPAAWHVSLLTSVYMLAAFVFAPLWGRWSDRFGRRPVLIAGLAGQAFTAALLSLDLTLGWVYVLRILNGTFAASAFPVAQAYAGEREGDSRARWFTAVGTASLLGFLAGPLIGGTLAAAVQTMQRDFSISPLLGAPWLASAVLAFFALFMVVASAPEPTAAVPPKIPASSPSPQSRWTRLLPPLGFIVMLAVGVFEVAITLQAKAAAGSSAFEIGILFAECSVAMIAAQFLAFSSVLRSVERRRMIVIGLLLMAVAIATMPFADALPALMLSIAIFSGSAGVLLPIAAYWLSTETPSQQGYALGRLSAYSNLGQAAGSLMSGALFGLAAAAPFVLTAAVLGAAALTLRPKRG